MYNERGSAGVYADINRAAAMRQYGTYPASLAGGATSDPNITTEGPNRSETRITTPPAPTAPNDEQLAWLNQQLDDLEGKVVLEKYKILGPGARRQGGTPPSTFSIPSFMTLLNLVPVLAFEEVGTA
jgi:hypothetical protein